MNQTTATVTERSVNAIEITLVDDAAAEVADLTESTGLSAEQLFEIAIRLLRVAATSDSLGRRMVITTKSFRPIKEVIFPKAS
ncbi:MAG: hypothetical protein ACR2NN_08310 [Bryobacteraceae bacterium]